MPEATDILIADSGTIEILAETMVDLKRAVNTLYYLPQRKPALVCSQLISAGRTLIRGNYAILRQLSEYFKRKAQCDAGFLRYLPCRKHLSLAGKNIHNSDSVIGLVCYPQFNGLLCLRF